MEFLKKIIKSKKSENKKKEPTIKKNKKIKLEKKPIIKEVPKKEKPPVEIKPKGKRGRPRNPELKKNCTTTRFTTKTSNNISKFCS